MYCRYGQVKVGFLFDFPPLILARVECSMILDTKSATLRYLSPLQTLDSILIQFARPGGSRPIIKENIRLDPWSIGRWRNVPYSVTTEISSRGSNIQRKNQ